MDAKLNTDLMTNKERFLDEQHNCPLCGSEMLITHVTQFADMHVKEQATCEACKINVRDLQHLLQ